MSSNEVTLKITWEEFLLLREGVLALQLRNESLAEGARSISKTALAGVPYETKADRARALYVKLCETVP